MNLQEEGRADSRGVHCSVGSIGFLPGAGSWLPAVISIGVGRSMLVFTSNLCHKSLKFYDKVCAYSGVLQDSSRRGGVLLTKNDAS